jgi:hypothetical protein
MMASSRLDHCPGSTPPAGLLAAATVRRAMLLNPLNM